MQSDARHGLQCWVLKLVIEGIEHLKATLEFLADEMCSKGDHLLRINLEEAKGGRADVLIVRDGQAVFGENAAFE